MLPSKLQSHGDCEAKVPGRVVVVVNSGGSVVSTDINASAGRIPQLLVVKVKSSMAISPYN